MKKRALTPQEQALCAYSANLPALKRRYDEALYSVHRRDLADAYLLLSTALWWHRDELIPALSRKKLRVVS